MALATRDYNLLREEILSKLAGIRKENIEAEPEYEEEALENEDSANDETREDAYSPEQEA